MLKRSLCKAIVCAILAFSFATGQQIEKKGDSPGTAEFRKLDASTLPITAKIHIGGDPDWLGIGFGSVWVSVPKNNEVVRINPQTNAIQVRIKVGEEPCYGIGIGKLYVWVLN
jgi:hypothetical protein